MKSHETIRATPDDQAAKVLADWGDIILCTNCCLKKLGQAMDKSVEQRKKEPQS